MLAFRIILGLIFFSTLACVSYKPRPVSPFFQQVIKNQANLNFSLEGKLKIKRLGYGWIGKIQVVKAKDDFRLDIFNFLEWPLFTMIKKGDRFFFISYSEGQTYASQTPPRFFKSLLHLDLPIEAWVALLGNQIWLINPDQYQLKIKGDTIWLQSKKGNLIEEIWIKQQGFKIKKIIFKTKKGRILCKIWWSYDSAGKMETLKLQDREGVTTELTYELFNPNPKIDPDIFNPRLCISSQNRAEIKDITKPEVSSLI